MLHKFLRSTTFWLTLSILVCILAYWRWFFTLNIYACGDWGYQNQEFIKQLISFPQAWHREFFGMVDIGLPQYLTARLFYSFLAQFLPFVLYDRIVFLLPTVLIPAISIFILVKQNSQNAFAGFVGVVVYCFNSYILTLNTGELTLSIAYSLGPFVFLLFKQAIYKQSFKYTLAASLAGIICAGYEPRGFYMVAIILIAYLFYSVFLSNNSAFMNRRQKTISILLGLLSLIIILFANAYWIIAALQTVSSYVGIAINTNIVGQFAYILPRPLVLFTPWWTGNGKDAWGAIQPILWYFWMIPLIAFLGLWFNRRKSDTIFWTLIALLGIFLTKSLGDPFGNIYPWLYSHIPGFNLFRDAAKFYFYISIAYAVLFGEFITWLWSKASFITIGKFALSVSILSLFFYNGSFLFRQQLGHLMTPRYLPNDYTVLRTYIFRQNQFMRILYVPQLPRWDFRDINHRMLNLESLSAGDWQEFNDYHKVGPDYSSFKELTNLFSKPYANQLLDDWSIKYIVIPFEDKENEETFYPKGTNMKEFVDFFNTVPYLKRINIGKSKLVVLENKNPSPHFVFTPTVQYTVSCPDATTCTFNFKSSEKSVTFYYSEAYHSGWKVRMSQFSWWQSLFTKNYFLPDSLHQRSQFDGNIFVLPQVKTGEKMTLYFAPQAYVNVGSIISAVTILSTSITLLLLIIFRKK